LCAFGFVAFGFVARYFNVFGAGAHAVEVKTEVEGKAADFAAAVAK
jgi:hypothetical protein